MDKYKKQILLIQPPVEDFYSTDCRTQPVGLAYLAAAVRAKFADLDIVIYDALSTGKKRTIGYPAGFDYLKRYYNGADRSPFRLFHQYYRFGKTREEMMDELAVFDPFLIGISSMFSPYYRQSIEVADVCRQLFPDATIVFGGSHASSEPGSLLLHREDFVIPGEGEEVLCDLIAWLLDPDAAPFPAEVVNRESIAAGKKIITRPPDVSRLPQPAFDLLSGENYTLNRKPLRVCVTSRGCPYRCSFCSIHTVFGRRYRRRSNDDIMAEIKKNVSDGVLQIDFEDDHFSANRGETLLLLDRIAGETPGLSLSLMNGVVYWTLDELILERMYQAGFRTLNLSLVSAGESPGESHRPDKSDRFPDIVRAAHKMGFGVIAYFILGRPGQTIEEMVDSLRLLASLPVLIGASPYYLAPGSPDYELFRHDPGVVSGAKEDRFQAARLACMDIETKDFQRDDIFTLFRLSRVVNYVKQGIDLGHGLDSDYYAPVREIGKTKTWERSAQEAAIPFSQKVLDLFFSGSVCVSGYKTGTELWL